jgi:hypothetical protein
MAQITITNNLDADVAVEIRDDSPLAKAKLMSLVTTAKDLIGDIDKPVDQTDLDSVSLGANFTSPDLLSSDLPSLTVAGGVNCGLSVVKSADKFLFGDDEFSPTIAIAANEAWVGVELDANLDITATETVNGVGVSEQIVPKVAISTYTLISVPSPPLPSLRDALATGFSRFGVTSSPAAIRGQAVGTVNQTEVGGCFSTTVSLSAPFTLNPLGSANLPFNQTASVQPTVTLELSGTVKITGDLIVRSYKQSSTAVVLGVYKKRGSTFSVAFTGGAGLEGEIGDTDILSALLTAAMPSVDVADAGITGANVQSLNGVIKDGLNTSLSAQINVTCSAAHTDEAAVLYQVQLDSGDAAATDAALGLALKGDWTGLEHLPNATRVRNIIVATAKKTSSMTLNLLGFYNAVSVADYLGSCTILTDASGQMSIADKLSASRISAGVAPHAADTEKLRRALVEGFLCTATYAVVADKLNFTMSVVQSYLDYANKMSLYDMNENVRLGYALGVIPLNGLTGAMTGMSSFAHGLVSAIVRYDTPALLDIFFADPDAKMPRKNVDVRALGRQVMTQLLDPQDPTDAIRISVLNSPAICAEMDELGSVATFHTIDGLSQLNPAQLGAVDADWVSIAWWADSLVKIAPALTATLNAIAAVPAGSDPSKDANFMKRRANLANVLGDVTRRTDAAFVHGWGAAVMFALSGRHGTAAMDVGWAGKSQHFGAANP